MRCVSRLGCPQSRILKIRTSTPLRYCRRTKPGCTNPELMKLCKIGVLPPSCEPAPGPPCWHAHEKGLITGRAWPGELCISLHIPGVALAWQFLQHFENQAVCCMLQRYGVQQQSCGLGLPVMQVENLRQHTAMSAISQLKDGLQLRLANGRPFQRMYLPSTRVQDLYAVCRAQLPDACARAFQITDPNSSTPCCLLDSCAPAIPWNMVRAVKVDVLRCLSAASS